jgi:hypothetical protein
MPGFDETLVEYLQAHGGAEVIERRVQGPFAAAAVRFDNGKVSIIIELTEKEDMGIIEDALPAEVRTLKKGNLLELWNSDRVRR